MTLYAMRTTNRPRHPECPASGWVHEDQPPYRVIVADDRDTMPPSRGDGTREVVEYTGDEDTVTWDELLPPPARSTAKADAERLHYTDDAGTLRCPEEYREDHRFDDGTPLHVVRCPHFFDPMRYERVDNSASV